MATVQSPVSTQHPSHTFLDQRPPLLPRQSTGDVLSFTKIIADRLAPGQNVWEYFSPAPSVATPDVLAINSTIANSGATSPVQPLSPTSPTSSFGFFGSKLPPISTAPTATGNEDMMSTAAAVATQPNITSPRVTPRAQKRRSFAQSFRSSIYSISQLIAASSKHKATSASSTSQAPHYNILVLGSDSAPIAGTLYKMSSLLPSTNKISHYQEISGFFVAHFRSNGSFSCSLKTSTELSETDRLDGAKTKSRPVSMSYRSGSDGDEVKSRRTSGGLEDIDQERSESATKTSDGRPLLTGRSSGDSEATLLNALSRDDDDKATLYQEPLSYVQEDVRASANATLAVHAFSVDTTWPVPRVLAQTFWFPHAHGIIYIVDATRKNDPRGMDHLLNARQFLSSLVSDPNFKRRDIPIVVFANKAGLDDETCFRVDEIADILGCEEWDDEGRVSMQATNLDKAAMGSPATRPWCVKSTRTDGEGEGLREAVEWLKSRMGEIWKL
ncbi:hypothetical protein BGZ98_007711 [Dissophora globulifera]|nr:hypothetical protein BGZ98_007711 [Dissophora globulifera]